MGKIRFILALPLVVLVFFFSFHGCDTAGNQKDRLPAGIDVPAGDKMKISIALWNIEEALSRTGNDQFYKHLSDKFNITIEPVPITWDDYTQKIRIWASSAQLPDIFAIDAVGTSYYREWVNRGIIKALPEDLSRYPYLKKYLEKPDIQILKEKGKMYCVPRTLYDSLKYCAHDRNVFYRWDLAQKAGITREPETWDEFEQMLEAIIKKDPEGKGICGLTFVNVKHIGGFFWLYSNPAAASDGSGYDYKWVKEDGRYIPAVFSKNSLPALEFARGMFEKGLIDKELTMLKGTQGYNKFASGHAAAILMVSYGNLDTQVRSNWEKAYPGKKLVDCVKRVKYFPATDGQKYQSVFKTYWSESYFSGKMDVIKMDRIMQLYDYMLSPQAKEFYRFGVKNADYKKDGDRIIPGITPGELRERQYSASLLSSLVEFDNQFQYDDNNFSMDRDIRKAAVKDLTGAVHTTRIPEYKLELTYMTTPLKERFSIYDHEDIMKVMFGKEPVERMWAGITGEYRAKGLDKMIGEVNAEAKKKGID